MNLKRTNSNECHYCCCYVASVMSNSVRLHRWKPSRLHHPWDSPGKNPGVGCHFLLQHMKGKSESEVAQSSPTLSDPMDYSLPGFSIHGVFQAEWGAIAFSEPMPQIHKKIISKYYGCLYVNDLDSLEKMHKFLET